MNKETASTMIREMRDSLRRIAAWPPPQSIRNPPRPLTAAYARGMADAYTIVLGMLADDVVDGEVNKETASTMIRAMRDSAREIPRPLTEAYARGMADAHTIVLGMLADDVVDGPWASVMGPARSAPEDQ